MSDTGTTVDHDAERQARKKRRRLAAISWLASSLMLVLALVATSPYWAPPLASIFPWGRLAGGAAIGGRIDVLERKLDDLAGQASAPIPPPDLADIQDRLQNQAVAAAKLQDGAQKLDQRLTALEARISGMSDDPKRLMLVTLDQLAAAVETSRPYGGELAAAEALAAGKPEILTPLKTLDVNAAKGIPGAAVLARQFLQQVAPALMRAGADTAAADESWWRRILARLRSLVVIRRTGEEGQQAADPVAAAVATAEAALDQGDVAGAVGAIQGLAAEAASPAQDWLGLAQQRLAAEGAVAQAIASAAQGLSQPGARSP